MGSRTGIDTLAEAETLVGSVSEPSTRSAEATPTRFGELEVRGILGEGAIGRVYRAFDPATGQEVAVKQVRQNVDRDSMIMTRFQREAETVKQLTHPNLVRLRAVGRDYMVMDLVEGESLEEQLKRRGTLEPAETVTLLGQVAEALDYIHARGIVHRDVKPSNVLVQPDGTARLTDFGIAHLSWAPITRTGELIGSPAFMAPEQVALGEVEPASDVYALGILAYQCLAGARPFSGKSLGALLRAVVYDTPPPATERNPSLPSAVDAVLARALAKDPDERYDCARDFVAALQDALGATNGGRRKPGVGTLVKAARALVL